MRFTSVLFLASLTLSTTSLAQTDAAAGALPATAPGSTTAPTTGAPAPDKPVTAQTSATGTPTASQANGSKDKSNDEETDKVQPHYALDIDAPEPVRGLIERQTLIGKWRTRREYDRDQFEALLANLKPEVDTICKSQGYFDCTIDISGDPSRVKVKVDPGRRATIRKVQLQLRGPIESEGALREQLLRTWAMPEGGDYDAAGWENSKRKLVASLQQNGYLRARIVDSQASVDVESAAMSLSVDVDSGARVKFGELRVNGLDRYPRSLIDGLVPYGEGDPYNFDKLQQFQANLRDSGYFRNAYVSPELSVLDDPTVDAVPLKVELTEEQVKRATYGVGYGTDAGARLILGLEHRNLFNRGYRMDSGLILEERRQRAFFGVRTPTDTTGHYWAYGARYDRQDVQGEKTGTTTVYGGRGKRSGRIDMFTSVAMQNERQAIDLGDGTLERDHSKALVLGFTWNYRDLDSRIDPRAGFSFSSQTSVARQGLLTDTSFLRLYTRTLYFLPMNRERPSSAGVWVGLLEVGQVFSSTSQGIPSTNLFRAGGAQSVRGYEYNSIGVARGTAVVGGRVLGVGSIEYQHPITDLIWGAAFFDVGGAAQTWSDYKLYKGYGVGVRLRTPVGPINLDAAYGDADRRWRLAFSVGFLF